MRSGFPSLGRAALIVLAAIVGGIAGIVAAILLAKALLSCPAVSVHVCDGPGFAALGAIVVMAPISAALAALYAFDRLKRRARSRAIVSST